MWIFCLALLNDLEFCSRSICPIRLLGGQRYERTSLFFCAVSCVGTLLHCNVSKKTGVIYGLFMSCVSRLFCLSWYGFGCDYVFICRRGCYDWFYCCLGDCCDLCELADRPCRGFHCAYELLILMFFRWLKSSAHLLFRQLSVLFWVDSLYLNPSV